MDAISQYFAEMGAIQLFDHEQERDAYRAIEKAESALIRHILTGTRARASLPELFRLMEKAKESREPPDLKYMQAVKDAVRLKSFRVLPPDFVRAIRYTEPGRNWYEEQVRQCLQEKGKSNWMQQTAKLHARQTDAKNKFVQANLRFVVSIARKYHRPYHSMALNDLIQEGNLGLMKAVERFDLDRGFKFSTYAMWWIRHHVKRSIDEKDQMVRLPVHLADTVNKIGRIEGKRVTETGEKPEAEEIAKLSGVPLSKVKAVLATRGRSLVSLDAPINKEGDETPWVEHLPADTDDPFELLTESRLRDEIMSFLTLLTPYESRIIRWRFGFDGDALTLQEIADKFALSRERIRQIEARAIQKLKSKPSVLAYVTAMLDKAG